MTSCPGQTVISRARCIAAAIAIICVPSASSGQSADSPLRISPETAVSLALANNLSLESARRSPEIADLNIRGAESAWKPSIAAAVGQYRTNAASSSFERTLGVVTDTGVSSAVTLSQQLPWGASYDVGWSSVRRSNTHGLTVSQPEVNAAATGSVTQPLLHGFAIDAARADRTRTRQARDRAGFELGGTVASLRRDVLYAYWQWVYTRDFRRVAQEALGLARALLDGNRERVAARAMAPTDVIEAEAEVARRDEAVIIAEKNVANAEDRLRLLILDPRGQEFLTPLEPADVAVPNAIAATADLLTRALVERSDVQILKSAIQTDTLNVRYLKNETLPDVNVTGAFSAQAVGAGVGLADLGQLRYPGWSMEVSIAYPVSAAAAKANAARAQVEKRQRELSLAALEQRVTTEVRSVQREVETNQKRLESTATAVSLAERRLAAEEEKFLVGLSTSFFVFQAQRDLASARVANLGAILDHRISLADVEAVQSTELTPIP